MYGWKEGEGVPEGRFHEHKLNRRTENLAEEPLEVIPHEQTWRATLGHLPLGLLDLS